MYVYWEKSNDKPRQCIKKQRGHFANKVPYSQSWGFSISHVQMWELDHKGGWELKNGCFWTVSLGQQGDQTQSILKKINLEYSLEGLMLKLKLPYFGHLMQRSDSLENTLILRKTDGKRRRGWQRMKWLDSITKSMDISLSKLREIMKDRGAWHAAVHAIIKSWTWLSN